VSKPARNHDDLGGSNRLLSMAEAAAYLSTTPDSLKVNYRRWEIPVVRIGRSVRFRERSLNVWIKDREAA
jgi:excisionase family DNA binding protein